MITINFEYKKWALVLLSIIAFTAVTSVTSFATEEEDYLPVWMEVIISSDSDEVVLQEVLFSSEGQLRKGGSFTSDGTWWNNITISFWARALRDGNISGTFASGDYLQGSRGFNNNNYGANNRDVMPLNVRRLDFSLAVPVINLMGGAPIGATLDTGVLNHYMIQASRTANTIEVWKNGQLAGTAAWLDNSVGMQRASTPTLSGHWATNPLDYWNSTTLAAFWMHKSNDGTALPDVSKFITADGRPVNLGPDGSLPTGTKPMLYMDGNAAEWKTGTNHGSGGDMVLWDGTGSTNNSGQSGDIYDYPNTNVYIHRIMDEALSVHQNELDDQWFSTQANVQILEDGAGNGQIGGYSFPAVDVPKDTTVTSARLRFKIQSGNPLLKFGIVAPKSTGEALSENGNPLTGSTLVGTEVTGVAGSSYWWDIDLTAQVNAVLAHTNWESGDFLNIRIKGETEGVPATLGTVGSGGDFDPPTLFIYY